MIKQKIFIMVTLCALTSSALVGAEKTDPNDPPKITRDLLNDEGKFKFKPKENRRDPLYSVLDEAKVQYEIDENIRKQKAEESGEDDTVVKPGPVDVMPTDDDPILDALNKARYYAERSQVELLNGNWDTAVTEADSGLKVLQQLPDSGKYANAIQIETIRLNGFRQTARDAKLNQEAEDKFNALNLEVQGIMWSADQRSLAIISGEAYYVQDKIGDGKNAVTIVNIDPNRVDFMINHVQRNFEFKRYIDN